MIYQFNYDEKIDECFGCPMSTSYTDSHEDAVYVCQAYDKIVNPYDKPDWCKLKEIKKEG